MAQTPDGYLWIGTTDGLVRFDGRTFDLFDRGNTPEMKASEVSALLCDREGTLWIGMRRGGLVSLRDGRFRFHGPDETSAVLSIAQAPDGTLFVGGSGTEVRTVSPGGSLRPFLRLPDELGQSPRLAADAKGRLWVSSQGADFVVEGGRARPFTRSVDAVWGMAGRVWLSHGTGLGQVVGDTIEPLIEVGTRPGSVTHDRDGNTWATFDDAGLVRISPSGDRAWLRPRDGLLEKHAPLVFADAEGALWLAAWTGALHQLVDGPIVVHGQDQGLGSNVRTVLAARDGSLWSAAEEGVFRLSEGRVTRLARPAQLAANQRICSMAETPDGQIWVGTWNGLFTVDGDRLASVPPLEHVWVFSLLCDRRGRLWVGTADGLWVRDGDQLRKTAHAAGDGVFTIHEDPTGRIWLGTTRGLWEVVSEGVAERRPLGDHLEQELVFSIADRTGGGLWVGMYEAGLARYPAPHPRTLGTRDGLPSDSAELLAAADGSVWITAGRHLARVSEADLDRCLDGDPRRLVPELLGVDDGLGPHHFLGGGGARVARTPDGLLWFPSSGGLVALDPGWRRTGPVPPRTSLRETRLDGSLVPREALARIPPGLHRLEIAYTGIWLRAPAKVRHRYRLTGLDPDWIDAADRRNVDLTHLPPGRFRFEVQSTVDGKEWSVPATLPIAVSPFFWQRIWFWPSLVILVTVVASGAFRARVKRLESEERELAGLVEFGRSLAGLLEPEEIVRLLQAGLAERLGTTRRLVIAAREGRASLEYASEPGLALASLPASAEAKRWTKPLRLESLGDGAGELERELRRRGLSLVVPFVRGDTSFGYVALGPPAGRARFTASEVEKVGNLVSQAALALEGAWQAQDAVRWRHVSEARQEWLELDLLSRLAFAAVARVGSEGPVPEEAIQAALSGALSGSDAVDGARITDAIERLVEAGALSRAADGGLLVEKRRWLLLPELRQPLAEISRQGAARVGAFRLLDRIGVGGMGEVYRGVNVHDGSFAAVKLLFPYQTGDAEARRRLEREGELVARLQHPGIVRLLERGEHDGRLYVAMELLRGETLAARIQRTGPLPRAEAFGVLSQLVSALATLHAAGVVHRDIKSANVMCEPDGRCVLLDFGLARGIESSTLTQAQAVLGTLPFMSPEQLRGESVGPPSDLWSLGVVFHEMLAGQVPWAGVATIRMALTILGEERLARVSLGADVDWILDALLQRDPAWRPPDGGALMEILAKR